MTHTDWSTSGINNVIVSALKQYVLCITSNPKFHQPKYFLKLFFPDLKPQYILKMHTASFTKHLHIEDDQSILIETSSCNRQFFSELNTTKEKLFFTWCHRKQSLLSIINLHFSSQNLHILFKLSRSMDNLINIGLYLHIITTHKMWFK